MTIRVLIVDDHELFRSGMHTLLAAQEDITVVGEASNGSQAVERARSLLPDVVIMDVRMDDELDGVMATQRLTADDFLPGGDATIKILMLSTYDELKTVLAALQAGASGFLLKDAAPNELTAAVRAVHAGHGWLAPSIAPGIIAEILARPSTSYSEPGMLEQLTPRETEVLILIAHGLTNPAIAKHFTIAEATVRTHVNRLRMKTGFTCRAQLVVLAYQSGLVVPGSPPPPTLKHSTLPAIRPTTKKPSRHPG